MSEKDNGGPAFPIITPDMPVEGSGGITIRDYFAAKAMQGVLGWDGGWTKIGSETWSEALARQAYEYADAMLQARKQQESP